MYFRNIWKERFCPSRQLSKFKILSWIDFKKINSRNKIPKKKFKTLLRTVEKLIKMITKKTSNFIIVKGKSEKQNSQMNSLFIKEKGICRPNLLRFLAKFRVYPLILCLTKEDLVIYHRFLMSLGRLYQTTA